MPLSIGVNLRVTGHCNQGGRKYMEDMFSVAYQQSHNDRELEYAFFGIFDGHGGGEAATFAKENLMDTIVKQKNFWSDKDEDVLRAIRDGYVNTHYAMWRELEKWPKTASGLPSTAGTTASIAFIRKGKIYIGHVGDSGIVLGYQDKGDPIWKAKPLTTDHKPECGEEMNRIRESGGKVVSKSGVPRVVWNRPRIGHKGPVRRSTHIDEIPFLAVARSLGDLWSYNSELNTFVVSPEPDVNVVSIDIKSYRCLIFGTDGLWNMLTPQAAVSIVQAAERHNEKHLIASQQTGSAQNDVHMWINPSKSLVDRALSRWSSTRLRADNTSVVTLMLDPPGPSHTDVILSRRKSQVATSPLKTSPIHPVKLSEQVTEAQQVESMPYDCSVQKEPDSSFEDEPLITSNTPPKKYPTSPRKTPVLHHSHQVDVSIQVDKISSSDAPEDEVESDSQNLSGVKDSSMDETIVDLDSSSGSSSTTDILEDEDDLEEPEVSKNEDSSLQDVPKAELFPEVEVSPQQQQQHQQQQHPVITRSISGTNEMMKIPKRKSKSILLHQVDKRRTRRHSTGQHRQRSQNPPRRSLTPKVSVPLSFSKSFEESNSKRIKSNGILSSDSRHNETKRFGNSMAAESHSKKRTRSEDDGDGTDENNPVNQKIQPPFKTSQERRLSSPSSFKRRNLEKKVTPVKSMRRSSLGRTSRVQMKDGGFGLRDWESNRISHRSAGPGPGSARQNVVNKLSLSSDFITSPKRWLRSDTVAATPTKTLRSRNVELTNTPSHLITNPCSRAKPSSVVLVPVKLKQNAPILATSTPKNPCTPINAQASRTKQTSSCLKTPTSTTYTSAAITSSGPSSGISKRVKTPYNLGSRSLTTRSRIKRFK